MTQISMRAVARLAGVSEGIVGRALKSFDSEKVAPLASFLIQKGFSKEQLKQVAIDGVPITLQVRILEYYAFNAGRYCSEKAYESLCDLNKTPYVPRKNNKQGKEKLNCGHRNKKEYKISEKGKQKGLHEIVGGDMEVPTQVGRIDILTDTELIEVKKVQDWKGGIGQLIAYGYFYPNHTKRLHLFGKVESTYFNLIKEIAATQDIVVTWES